jgi:hypothetical protein
MRNRPRHAARIPFRAGSHIANLSWKAPIMSPSPVWGSDWPRRKQSGAPDHDVKSRRGSSSRFRVFDRSKSAGSFRRRPIHSGDNHRTDTKTKPSSWTVTMAYVSKSPSENSDQATGFDESSREFPFGGSHSALSGPKIRFSKKLTYWVSPSVIGIGFIATLIWMVMLGWLVVRFFETLF